MAEPNKPEVGLRLRSLREEQGLSLRTLAERCGLSINAISLIERGQNSPTVATLHRLATGLEVPITDFFQQEAGQTLVFIQQGTGLQAQANGVVMESLGIGLQNQQLEPFRMIVEPGAGNLHEPISHAGQEFVHCLEGEIEYLIAGQVFHLAPGDSLLFEAGQPHTYRNKTRTPATVLLIFQASQDRHGVQRLHLENGG